MSSQAANASTQETTPLLAGGENRSVHDDADANANADTPDRHESPGTVYRSLPGIDKFFAQILVVVLATSVVQLAFALTAVIMWQYGTSRYNFWDYELETTLPYYICITILGIIVALYDLALLRRDGQPGYALLNILAFGIGGVMLGCIAIVAVADKVWLGGRSVCQHGQREYSDCLQWQREYTVIVWIYFSVGLILAFEYLVLFVASLAKVYRQRHQSTSSSSTFEIPAGFLAFEVRVKWGNTESERGSSGSNTIATAPTRQDEEPRV